MMTKERPELMGYSVYIQQIPVSDQFFLQSLLRKKDIEEKKVRDALLVYAISKNKKEWIYELLKSQQFPIDDFIDEVNQKTLLASIIQYPYYDDLFINLINRGASIFKDTKRGDKHYRSNALMLSVLYNEFSNLGYMLEKGLVSYIEVLTSCVEHKNFVLLGHFLSECPRVEVKEFLILSQHLMKDPRVQRVIDDYVRNTI